MHHLYPPNDLSFDILDTSLLHCTADRFTIYTWG